MLHAAHKYCVAFFGMTETSKLSSPNVIETPVVNMLALVT